MGILEKHLRELWNIPKQTHRPIVEDESDKPSWEEFSLRTTKPKDEIRKAIINFYEKQSYVVSTERGIDTVELFTINLFNRTHAIGVTITLWEDKIRITVVLVG